MDGTCVELIQSKTICRNNTSGVTWNNQQNRWDATFMFKGKRHYLGGYGRFEDAVNAYYADMQAFGARIEAGELSQESEEYLAEFERIQGMMEIASMLYFDIPEAEQNRDEVLHATAVLNGEAAPLAYNYSIDGDYELPFRGRVNGEYQNLAYAFVPCGGNTVSLWYEWNSTRNCWELKYTADSGVRVQLYYQYVNNSDMSGMSWSYTSPSTGKGPRPAVSCYSGGTSVSNISKLKADIQYIDQATGDVVGTGTYTPAKYGTATVYPTVPGGYTLVSPSSVSATTTNTGTTPNPIQFFVKKDVAEYNHIWKDWNGTELYSTTSQSTNTLSYPNGTPKRDSTDDYDYAFSGWDKVVDGTTVTYTATYTQTAKPITANYKVEWVGTEGTTLKATVTRGPVTVGSPVGASSNDKIISGYTYKAESNIFILAHSYAYCVYLPQSS